MAAFTAMRGVARAFPAAAAAAVAVSVPMMTSMVACSPASAEDAGTSPLLCGAGSQDAGAVRAYSASDHPLEGATTSEHNPNTIVLQSRALRMLFTKVRATDTQCAEFVHTSNRLMGLLAEEALAHLATDVSVATPCGVYAGLAPPAPSDLAAISIMRAGDSLLRAVRKVIPGIACGKVLIQRNEDTPDKRAEQSYAKLPVGLKDKKAVLLVDPMLATGGSVCRAITELVAAGVEPQRIMFINVVCCPEGLQRLATEWPQVTIVTAAVDEKLNGAKYIVPGLGDFGDRYYGTV